MKKMKLMIAFLFIMPILHAQTEKRVELRIESKNASYTMFISSEAYKLLMVTTPDGLIVANSGEKQYLHRVILNPATGNFLLRKDDNFKKSVLCFDNTATFKVDSIVITVDKKKLLENTFNHNLKIMGYNSDASIDIITISQGVLIDVEVEKKD